MGLYQDRLSKSTNSGTEVGSCRNATALSGSTNRTIYSVNCVKVVLKSAVEH